MNQSTVEYIHTYMVLLGYRQSIARWTSNEKLCCQNVHQSGGPQGGCEVIRFAIRSGTQPLTIAE